MAQEPIGAIVVPSHFSERIYRAVVAAEGWMDALWNLTEFESDTALKDSCCVGVLHAVHLSRRGSGVLNALAADLPQSDQYHMPDVLGSESPFSRGTEERLVCLDFSNADKKILQKLRVACDHVELLGESGSVFWMPGISLESPECRQRWDAPIYESWHVLKNLAPAPRFTFVDLFAGIGGFRLGLEALGGRCVLACEENPHARATYTSNFAKVEGQANPLIDIRCARPESIPPFDILTAGFPCQPFTELACDNRQGLDCGDGQLVHELIRILRECQPAAALLENVAGLLTINRGADFKKIVAALKSVGYAVGWQLISAEHFVPQRRLRLYIVCMRQDIYDLNRNCQSAPCCLSQRDDGYFGGENVINWLEVDAWKHDPDRQKPVVKDILHDSASFDALEASTLTEDQLAKVVEYESRSCKLRRGGLEKRFVDIDGLALTLTSTYKRNYRALSQFVSQIDSRPRFFTMRECARLMGFPDSFEPGTAPGIFRNFNASLSSAEGNFYHQIGNAVVPAVIQEIGSRILDVIRM